MTMAVDSTCQKEHQIQEFLEGNGNLPMDCVDNLNRQLPLDIPPILVEETSLPAGLDGSQAQDVYSISLVPEEGENASSASPLSFLSTVEVPNPAKSAMCFDGHINCQHNIDFQMKREDVYTQCIIDIPNVNGNSVSPESYEEGVESYKTGNSPTSVLWRESSLKAGAKLMQSLVNLSNPRDKPVTEKLHDLPSNKWRRYKRSTSFDSRKVALLFSVFIAYLVNYGVYERCNFQNVNMFRFRSSLGTLVLIYLTLRVRQRADGFVLM